MSRPRVSVRLLAALLIVSIAVPALVPVASAGIFAAPADPTPRSVGTYHVVPIEGKPHEGRATGSLTSAIIQDASADASGSVIKDFTITGGAGDAAAEKVFSAIDIRGFQPTSRLEGVGTSALSLKSESLVIGMSDAAAGLLTFRATGTEEQKIILNTAADVIMQASGAGQNVWDVRGQGTSGVLILVQSAGQVASSGGSALALENQHKAVATLQKGTQLIYRANANYGTSFEQSVAEAASTYNEAAVKAVATGRLAGEATSEFNTGFSLLAQANFFATATAKTTTSEAKRVTTTLRSEVSASACTAADAAGSAAAAAPNAAGSATAGAKANVCAQMLAYDLDYVDLPAATAENVAVYINGGLAQRVDAASQVAAHADSYWATTVEGRVLVLTNVAAQAHAATQVTIAAVADAEATATTLAELDAMSDITAQLEGGYTLLGDLEASASGSGHVIGSFGAFFASEAKGAAETRDFTDIRSATTIFTRMHFAADATADASAQFTSTAQGYAAANANGAAKASGHARATMTTMVAGSAVAKTEYYDTIYAAFIAEAEATTQTDLTLSNDVGASFVGDAENVLALDGPAGSVGHLILVSAAGNAASASRFDLSVPGHVKAQLAEGDRLVFRGSHERQARAQADAAAEAIADRELAAEATVGIVANAIATANVDWSKDAHLALDKAAEWSHKGQITFDAAATGAAEAKANAFAVVTDRATLAARSADDIVVSIDGKLATAVDTAAQVYGSVEASYYVIASLQGQTTILFSVPDMAAGETHRIVITSTADAQARLKSALDIFGSFQPGYGGVADGSVVSLVAKPNAGLLLDYTVTARGAAKGALEATGFAAGALDSTTRVFDSVKVGGNALASASSSTASSLRYVSDVATVEVFDVSSGTMKIKAVADTYATLDLATNIEATLANANVIMLSAPDFSGAIILSSAHSAAGQAGGALDISGGIVNAQLDEGTQLIFKAFSGFEAELSAAQQLTQANAIANGKLLGQVIVDTAAGASALTTETVNINYYEDVKAYTSHASSERIDVLVDSASHAGKTLIISFDRDTVKGLIDGKAILMVDGVAVEQAKSYEDAFEADSDKYWLITSDGEVGLQAIVTLAHFSTRTVTIASPEATSVFVWSTLALALVVVGQVMYPRLKRKNA